MTCFMLISNMNCDEKITIRNERVEREECKETKKNKSMIARVWAKALVYANYWCDWLTKRFNICRKLSNSWHCNCHTSHQIYTQVQTLSISFIYFSSIFVLSFFNK